jgi:WhiB family redox-sensing transcriptional regulator
VFSALHTPSDRQAQEVSPVRTPSEGVLVAAPSAVALLDLDPFEAERAGVELPCRVQDPELWFAEAPADLELAKSHCLDCPVRRACLAGALERHEPWGVWGGEIFERGVVIPRKRPRGRPRKEVAA